MNLFKTILSFPQQVSEYRQKQKALSDIYNHLQLNGNRSIQDLYDSLQNPGIKLTSSFFDGVSGGYSSYSSSIAVGDTTAKPMDLYEFMEKETYFSGLFDQLIKALFKKDFYIERIKDEKGNKLGNEYTQKMLEDMLRRIDYEKSVEIIVSGLWGDGGGNVLLFTTKTNKGIKINVEPFLDRGYRRVEVWGDDKNKQILRYDVVDPQREIIYKLEPEKNYFKHLRYYQRGDYRFSSNPTKKAVYWYFLKKFIAGSNQAAFKNGLQQPVFMTTDYSQMKVLIEALQLGNPQNKAGGESKDEVTDPIKFWQSILAKQDDILKGLVGRPDKTNTLVRMPLGVNITPIGRDNRSMESTNWISICNEEMGYPLRSSKGIINTKDSKFANAEVEKDNWTDGVVDPVKRDIEKLTEDFILPALFPDFDKKLYKVRFSRDPNQEDIDIFNANTSRITAQAEVLSKVSTLSNVEVPSVKYDIEKNIFITTNEVSKVENETIQNNDDGKEEEEESVNEETRSINEINEFYLFDFDDENTRESKEERIERAYTNYHNTVNMSRAELENWSDNECSKKASIDRSPIRRNLELLDTLKKDWTDKHASWAIKTVGFITRMKKNLGGTNIVEDSAGKTCGTKAYIALKNWGFNPDKEMSASEYKTELKREDEAKKKDSTTLVDQILESKNQKKFEKILENSLRKQFESYVKTLESKDSLEDALKSLDKDVKPITNFGLTTRTLKEQLLKPAKFAIEDYIESSLKDSGVINKRSLSSEEKDILDAIINIENEKDRVEALQKEIDKREGKRVDYLEEVNEYFWSLPNKSKDVFGKTMSRADFFDYPEDILEILDLKSQLVVKGKESLTAEQLELVTDIYSRDLVNYKGVDAGTTQQIDSIIRNTLKEKKGLNSIYKDIKDLVQSDEHKEVVNELQSIIDELKEKGVHKDDVYNDIVELIDKVDKESIKAKGKELLEVIDTVGKDKYDVQRAAKKMQKEVDNYAKRRARTIANTESAQSLEGSRYQMYLNMGWLSKRWRDVRDDRVRMQHKLNRKQGWISITEDFQNGAKSPANEIECRCVVEYSKTKKHKD